ncbi:putative RNA-directed DNA polymerase, eukaryota, reverse transcriptase zinc-binding domain protein [Tanacetum coccineum]
MWGNYSFDYACSLARGRSGGLISMWDLNNFVKDDIWCDDAYIIVKGRWKNSVGGCYMINIYGPHDPLAKSVLWDRIRDFMHCNSGKCILFGDLNELLHDLDKLDTLEAMDSFQKERIKWDVEGDENTKFFHCLINQKRRCNSINGIMHDGAWVTDPQLVKQIFLNFFKCKFQANDSLIDFPLITTSSRLNDADCAFLEANACMVEVKDAVLANRLSKVVDKLISHEQSTFIKSRQILDGPLFLSEAIDWYKKRKKKMLLFKVDFEKAFDSVSWRYLDYMLCNLGFGLSWRSWIKACLESSRTSILINGSPTSEFNVRRGLRQGDPLSYFLFIIIMEGLHVALTDSVRSGLIRGINFGSLDLNLSHLFFADDVIITTDWNVHDLDNVIHIFQVFFLASGLKINIHKSSIYGIGVASDDIQIMAANTGCSADTLPLTYLGLPIGSNMSLIVNWKPLVDKFRLKLSSWKANLLSYGGRLTLIKAVLGSLGIYFFSLFKAPVAILKALESAHGASLLLRIPYGLKLLKRCMVMKVVLISMAAISEEYGRRLLELPTISIRAPFYPWTLFDFSHIEVRDNADKCFWSLDPNGSFSVVDLRRLIDDHTLTSLGIKTTWDKPLPRKEIWRTTRMWCEDSFPLFESNDHWIDWLISWPASCDKKHRVFVIIAAYLWQMSTSTMDHFTPSPNEKYYRSPVFPKIKNISDRIVRRCFPKLKENNAFFRPLDREARKYGDYVCFNVFEICEELRKNNPDLFDERKPKDIAMRVEKMFNDGIDTCAPVIYESEARAVFLSRTDTQLIPAAADMLRADFIKDALARIFLYSGIDILDAGVSPSNNIFEEGQIIRMFSFLKRHKLAECGFDIDKILNEEGNTFRYVRNTRALICSFIKNSRDGSLNEALAGKEELLISSFAKNSAGGGIIGKPRSWKKSIATFVIMYPEALRFVWMNEDLSFIMKMEMDNKMEGDYIHMSILPKIWKDVCKAAKSKYSFPREDNQPHIQEDKRTVRGCEALKWIRAYAIDALGIVILSNTVGLDMKSKGQGRNQGEH